MFCERRKSSAFHIIFQYGKLEISFSFERSLDTSLNTLYQLNYDEQNLLPALLFVVCRYYFPQFGFKVPHTKIAVYHITIFVYYHITWYTIEFEQLT